MAIYYTLGVDCGCDQSLAERIVARYDGLTITAPGVGAIECMAHCEEQRGLWFVCVFPRGMGYATLPASERRPELVAPEVVNEVRRQLYALLMELTGFRRAMFGAECFDQLAYATHEEDSDIDFVDLISSLAEFPDDPAGCTVGRFCDGYRIVAGVAR